jgi:RNA polymerase sigma factor (sigma-70 family)
MQMTEEGTDEELLAAGDAQAFGLLYARRHPLVRAYLRRQLGPRDDIVLDLVAETFARALERRGQFDAERGTAASWLLAIAHNLIVDAARHGKVADQSRHRLGMGPIELIDEDLERVHERDGFGEARAELQRYVSELPPEQREAVERRVLEESPYAVMAEQIGCSQQVARKRVSRGLAALRERIEETI